MEKGRGKGGRSSEVRGKVEIKTRIISILVTEH